MKKILLLSCTALFFWNCNSKTEEKVTDEIDYSTYEKTNENDQTSTSAEATTNHIVIKGNDDMTYDRTKFTIKAGTEVTLLLLNAGTMSKEAMGHNVIVLKKGVKKEDFAYAASSEKSNDYFPENLKNDVIAHTKLLGTKESDQIKFTITEPGTYDFICTFPGHLATMQGTITVIE